MFLRKTKLTKETRWTTVYLTKNDALIHIVKLKLESEGIPVMIFDQRDSSYNTFGDIYLQVLKEHEIIAREIIEQD